MEDGLFDDAAVIRRVAREGLLLAGGGRATLLQVAHPGVAHGVYDHSDFADRPLVSSVPAARRRQWRDSIVFPERLHCALQEFCGAAAVAILPFVSVG